MANNDDNNGWLYIISWSEGSEKICTSTSKKPFKYPPEDGKKIIKIGKTQQLNVNHRTAAYHLTATCGEIIDEIQVKNIHRIEQVVLEELRTKFKQPMQDGKRIFGNEYFEAAEFKFYKAVMGIILYYFKEDIVNSVYLVKNIKPDIETETMFRKVPTFSIELEEYMKKQELDDKEIQEYKRIWSTNASYFQHLRICKYFIDINLKNNTIHSKYEEKFNWLINFKAMTNNKDVEDVKCNNGVTEEDSITLNRSYNSIWKKTRMYKCLHEDKVVSDRRYIDFTEAYECEKFQSQVYKQLFGKDIIKSERIRKGRKKKIDKVKYEINEKLLEDHKKLYEIIRNYVGAEQYYGSSSESSPRTSSESSVHARLLSIK